MNIFVALSVRVGSRWMGCAGVVSVCLAAMILVCLGLKKTIFNNLVICKNADNNNCVIRCLTM